MKDRIRKYRVLALLVLPGGFFAACEHEIPLDIPQPQPGTQATFTAIQNTILSRKCAVPGCHTGNSPTGDLNMTAGQAYGNLVNVNSNYGPPRIAPNDPDNSVLYQKVLGNNQFGSRMPLGGNSLSPDELKLILDWINTGAPNN
jgi:hypothetical protein